MMELTCAFVLTLVGLVAGNPYGGYGAKGGAGARADASAVAGSFGGLGNIPAGGAFSGSYSKSSASSFASSSASSSSSSFSYSGSGNIGPGCTTGGCQKGSEGSISPGSGSNNPGYGFQSQNGAHAGAIAAAGAAAGSFSQNAGHAPCTSGTCLNQKPSGCQGPNCGSADKCTSGQCGTSSSVPTSSSGDYGNDDIPVNVGGTADSKTTDAHSSQYDKAGSYQPSKPACSGGNCGSSNTNPSYPYANVNPGSGPDNLKPPKCNSPHCSDNSQSESQSSVNVPATTLTAPKDYPNPGTGRLPLNYNVPNQNAYLTPAVNGKTGPCSSGKCNNNQPHDSYNPANGNSYSSNYLGPNFPTEQNDLLSNSKCTSGNCALNSYNNGNPKSPGYSQTPSGPVGNHPSPAPYPTSAGTYPDPKNPSSGGNCAYGNCGSYPSTAPSPTGSGTYPGSKIPSYSQTPSSPEGNCASGNCGSYPSTAPSPTGSSTYPGSKIPSYSQTPSSPEGNCASGNCDSFPSPAQSPTGPSTYPGSKIPSYSQTPSSPGGNCPSGNCGGYPLTAPSSTGSSTYPESKNPGYSQTPSNPGANCASGNCGNYPSNAPNPTGAYSGSKIPNYSQTPSGPAGNCASGNCGNYPSPAPTPVGGSTYPGSKIPSYTQPPTSSAGNCASGNCGNYPSSATSATSSTSAGANAYPGSKIPSYSQGASPTLSSTGPTSLTNCGTSNCLTSPGPITKPSNTFTPPHTTPSFPGHYGAAAGANAQAGSIGVYKPASGSYPSDEEKLPPYTGGFGGPSGILKPHDYSLPSKPTYQPGQQPTNQPTYPGTSAFPSTSHDAAPTSPTSLNKPGSCTSGNCGSQPAQPLPSFGPSNSIKNGAGANAGAIASASANSVAYTGGFGGPPGLLKPYDDGKLGTSGTPGSAGKPNAGYQNAVQPGNYGIATGGNSSPHTNSGSGTGNGPHAGATGSGNHSPYGKSINGVGSGSQSGTGAFAAAGATAGAFNSANNNHGSGSPTGGCGGSCGGTGGSPYGDGHNFGAGNAVAGASAKSIAGAVSGAGAGSYGHAGSYASSSASAHASSGFPAKGGYGRR